MRYIGPMTNSIYVWKTSVYIGVTKGIHKCLSCVLFEEVVQRQDKVCTFNKTMLDENKMLIDYLEMIMGRETKML